MRNKAKGRFYTTVAVSEGLFDFLHYVHVLSNTNLIGIGHEKNKLEPKQNKDQNVKLKIWSHLAHAYREIDALRKFAEHERSTTVASGEAKRYFKMKAFLKDSATTAIKIH